VPPCRRQDPMTARARRVRSTTPKPARATNSNTAELGSGPGEGTSSHVKSGGKDRATAAIVGLLSWRHDRLRGDVEGQRGRAVGEEDRRLGGSEDGGQFAKEPTADSRAGEGGGSQSAGHRSVTPVRRLGDGVGEARPAEVRRVRLSHRKQTCDTSAITMAGHMDTFTSALLGDLALGTPTAAARPDRRPGRVYAGA
jgi:hypothetical protein